MYNAQLFSQRYSSSLLIRDKDGASFQSLINDQHCKFFCGPMKSNIKNRICCMKLSNYYYRLWQGTEKSATLLSSAYGEPVMAMSKLIYSIHFWWRPKIKWQVIVLILVKYFLCCFISTTRQDVMTWSEHAISLAHNLCNSFLPCIFTTKFSDSVSYHPTKWT